jgi:hypothetical protein
MSPDNGDPLTRILTCQVLGEAVAADLKLLKSRILGYALPY